VPTYGKLAGVGVEEVKDLLNVLADAGLVERRGIEGGRPGAFVLALTADGRRVARGESRPELALPAPARGRARARTARRGPHEPSRDRAGEGSAGAEPELDGAADADPEVLSRLKSWRTEEARRKGMPPYVIFHDSTLVALAAARPRHRDELRRVRGIGPAKLEAYGEALLGLLTREVGAGAPSAGRPA